MCGNRGVHCDSVCAHYNESSRVARESPVLLLRTCQNTYDFQTIGPAVGECGHKTTEFGQELGLVFAAASQTILRTLG